MKLSKKLLVISILISLIAISLMVCFYFQKEAKEKEAEQIKILLAEINDSVNLMDAIKSEMPKQLLETHEYLVDQALEDKFKLYQIDPKLKEQVMYHGARTQAIYINPFIKLKKEIWIPFFYHEVAHNYWHSKNPVETFEEFEAQLFNSEDYAYTVNCQAWNLVMRYYPIRKDELETELEQRLFRIYNNETEIYNEMIKGNLKVKELWDKIIEADIQKQQEYQRLLF